MVSTTFLSQRQSSFDFIPVGTTTGKYFTIFPTYNIPSNNEGNYRIIHIRERLDTAFSQWKKVYLRDKELAIICLPDFADFNREIQFKSEFISDYVLDFYKVNETAPGDTDTPVNGLTGEYFENIDFTNIAFARIDPQVDFVFGNAAPDPRVPSDGYSIRWIGQIILPEDRAYKFTIPRATPAKLYIDNSLVWNKASEDRFGDETFSVSLLAGTFPFTLEMWDDANSRGEFILKWEDPSDGTTKIMPTTQFLT